MLFFKKKQPPTLAELESKIKAVNEQMDALSITASSREWQKITKELQRLRREVDKIKTAV